jgi:hypothetical protein
MLLHVCAVFDSATQAYQRPIFVPSRGLAVRSFNDEVQRQSPDNAMYNHPDDFELRFLGLFDDNTGQLVSHQAETLSRAKDVKP